MDPLLDERQEAQSLPELESPPPPARDALPKLGVDGCHVYYDGELIHEAPSHEEAIVYRDRLIDIYS